MIVKSPKVITEEKANTYNKLFFISENIIK